ncbi:hypothetical protein HSX11_20835 [Oxalobacteraceae bacterium]|nr:hypothetical protein [Oxalobacteraceae bacterium]
MSACEACSRKGILIYPVRYAIACPAGADGVPGLSGNFQIENAPTDIGKAKYTLRSMRAGYMYVYDEKRKRLRAYVVMPHGLLSSFPLEYLAPNPSTIPPNPCTNQAEITFTRCIDIVHAARDPATNLWMGWSSVVWTKALIAKVEDVAWRRKHMQCINVPALLAGMAAHAAEFAQHYKEIAHFGADHAAMLKAFAFSNTSIGHEVKQHDRGASIVETMAEHGPYNKGFIVALNDPVGITNDLSELTLPTIDAGFDEDLARGKMSYDMLEAVEKSIRADARRSLLRDEDIAKISENSPDGDVYNSAKTVWKVIMAGGPARYRTKVKANKKKYGDDQAGRMTAAEDQAWEEISTDEKGSGTAAKRESLLDDARRKSFSDTYAAALRAFLPTNEKLTRVHAAWLRSEQLACWMAGIHDTQDIRSGYAYSESLTQCVGKAVASKPCEEQLLAWMNNGNLADPRNLYSRALLFNQDALIQKAMEPDLKGSDKQYENILNIYKETINRLEGSQAVRLKDRLALATTNIMVKALKNGTYSVMRHVALAHMTVIGETIIKTTSISVSDLAKWMFEEAKAQGITFSESNRKSKQAAYRQAEDVVKRAPANSGVIAYELNLKQLKQEHVFGPSSVKSVKVPGFEKAKEWMGSSTPQAFHLGVVTTIIQIVALGFVMQDLVNEDPFNKHERRTKGVAAVVGLLATVTDMAATTVAEAPRHPLAAFLPTQWAMDADRLNKVAKIAQKVGLAAGLVTAGYDIWNSCNAFKDGKNTLGVLYTVNAVLGALVAVTAFYSSMIFWPLLIVSFIVGITIAIVSNNKLKDWVSRCYFSNDVSTIRAATQGKAPFKPYPYPAANDEFNAYKSAMGM